jgi:hypothetical protein
VIWSVDFTADDWLRITLQRVLSVTLARLDRRRKGLIGFHDIQQRTALALPVLLRELKKRGYHVVHAVPAGQDEARSETQVEQLPGPPE